MTAQDQTILALYEVEGLSPDAIAEEMGFDLLAVKAKLMQVSQVYKAKVKGGIGTNAEPAYGGSNDVSESEYAILLQNYKNIALDTDVEAGTRARILKDLLDEKRGRNVVKLANATSGPTYNINILNTELKAIKAARERTLKISTPNSVVDVQSVTETSVVSK